MLLPAAKPWLPDLTRADGDRVLLEIWRSKDTFSAAYRHNMDRLFAGTRKRQNLSGHAVVNLQKQKPSRRKA